jgi:alkylglycerol monooxygenase
MLDLQTLAIGGFVVAIAVELAWGRRHYSFHDSVTNISLGLGSLVFGTITLLQGFAIHAYVYQHASLFELRTDSPWTWLYTLVTTDLAFYVSHRAMHRLNVFWAVHAVHHQSQELNLLVALRIGWFSVFLSWIFYLPFALFGISLGLQLAARAISAAYQFWLHTRLVGKLGILEYVFVTPSQHRVHHAINPRYLDRNYGGMLSIWDRMFGTFAEETEVPIYGTTRPFASFDPVRANFVEWLRIARLAIASPRLRDLALVWFRPPEWQAAPAPTTPPPIYDVASPRSLDLYIAANAALAFAAVIASQLGWQPTAFEFAVFAGELVVAMIGWGAWIEGRGWARPLERVRLASLAIVVVIWRDRVGAGAVVAALALIAALIAWTWLIPGQVRSSVRQSR